MHLTDIETYMNYLFSAALKKCRNFQDAEDLTSEVLLAALNHPKEIKDLKSWLSGVLNHKYYDMLRKKYKQPTISVNLLMEEEFLFQETATHQEAPTYQPSVFYEAAVPDIPEASETPTEEEIRREVAFLSAKYREVIVRHYLNGEKIQDIADSLHIPKGTVLSRLSTGREQMKKGFDSMERFEKQSYQPERLELSCNGSMGLNHEPWSLVDGDLMKQNILIAAYEKPVTCVEIALALGIPTAYIENAVNDLISSELMQQKGSKIYTDFMITTPEQALHALEVQIRFAKEQYSVLWTFLSGFRSRFCETIQDFGLTKSKASKLEYFYMLHLFSCGTYQAMQRLVPSKEEFPLRPDGGKWIAIGNHFPLDFNFETYKLFDYSYGGERISQEEHFFSSKSVSLLIYDSPPDQNKYQHGPAHLGDDILMKLLYVIDRGIPFHYSGLDPLYLKDLPHLAECGILQMEQNKPALAIPVISKEQYLKINEFFVPNIIEFANLLEPLLQEILPELKLPVPKHLETRIAEFRKYRYNQIPVAVIKEAIHRGEFSFGEHIPPMVLVIED